MIRVCKQSVCKSVKLLACWMFPALIMVSCSWMESVQPVGEDQFFMKIFGGNRAERGESMLLLEDGGFLLLGTSTSFGANAAQLYLVRTNSEGNIVWESTFQANGQATFAKRLYQTGNGQVLVLADVANAGDFQAFVARVDLSSGNVDGRIISEAGDSEQINAIIDAVDEPGAFFAVGSVQPNGSPITAKNFRLWRLNSNLTVQNRVTYGFPSEDFAVDITYAPQEGQSTGNSTLMVLGMSRDNPRDGLGGNDFLMVNFDFNFAVLSQKAYGGRGNDLPRKLVRFSGNSYLVYGESDSNVSGNRQLLIGRIPGNLASLGNGRSFIDSAFVDVGNSFESGDIVIRPRDGHFVFTGSALVGESRDLAFGILQSNYQLDQLHFFGHGSSAASDEGRAVLELPDGKFAIFGTTATGNFGASEKMTLIKINSEGQLRE